jgi:hypothetical protein
MKRSRLLLSGLVLLAGVSVGGALAATDAVPRGAVAAAAAAVDAPADRTVVADAGDRDRRHRHWWGQERRDGSGPHRGDRDRERRRDGSCDRAAPTLRSGDPAAPAPDNGLFGNRARPKVETN